MRIVANGIGIHVEQQGRGAPALVFLHYWGGSARTWRHVVGELAPSYRTIAMDQRGWGRSDTPPDGYALADLADDCAGVVRALGLTRHVLVGHSMGGKVAQLLASRRPPGLAGLVLVASAPPSPLDLPARARAAMAGAYATRSSVEATIDDVLTASALDEADREQVITDSLGGAEQAKRAWPEGASREDITGEVMRIAVPVLAIAGELDRVDTVAAARSELIPHVPSARLSVLPGTGHLSPLEAPGPLANLIDEFVAGLA